MVFNVTDVLFGLIGGLLIGLAAALMLLANGRIAGISGILGQAIAPFTERRLEAIAFVAGIIAAPVLYALAMEGGPAIGITANPILLLLGGLAVGYGTALGNGCTSGHGVCGMSRLSVRSIAATLTFMGAGVATAVLLRPLLAGG